MTKEISINNYIPVSDTEKDQDTFLLQYVFFMDKEGSLLTCDESGHAFLEKIDLKLFYSQLQAIKINSAITNTTIILGGKSYNLRMVPSAFEVKSGDFDDSDGSNPDNVDNTEYIIVLQDQTLFSYLFQKLNQAKPDGYHTLNEKHLIHSQLNKVLNSSKGGIFITNSEGTAIFANTAYEEATGLHISSELGRNISDLGASGYFNPVITPGILATGQSLTVLQKMATGKMAIISGSPIYDSSGKPILIVTCVNVITELVKTDYSNKPYQIPSIDLNINKKSSDHSIDIIAESPTMKTILQEAIKVARYDVTVLLLGESGVGKEVIASIIHASSGRNKEKFVQINCSAISPSLLESELFGYESGAFTGALSKGKPGLFEVADNGTLLLDEIGDLPIDLQSKLLRVIQSREFYRIGGLKPIKSNVRIVASTNKDLEQMIQKGEFREDLYYRLNVVALTLPPLRERRQDIKPLLSHFCYHFNNKYGTNKQFSEEATDILETYHWPGNIRELKNLVERLTVLCLEDLFLPTHLYSKYSFQKHVPPSEEDVIVNRIIPMKEAVGLLEQQLVSKTMSLCGSTRKAAELLGVSQSTVIRKLKELSSDGSSQ